MKVIELNENINAENDMIAGRTRERLRMSGTCLINVMSAPGSGKTTLLTAVVNMMKDRYRIVGMDVDIESELDAKRIADATGIEYIQVHNGGLCHIDAEMTEMALAELPDDADVIILENIGNLVCPAEFDVGAHINMMLYSVTEGDDKPLKYPLMYSVSDLIVITKTDALGYFDFDINKAKERIKKLNPGAEVLCVSAKTGDGMEDLIYSLEKMIREAIS